MKALKALWLCLPLLLLLALPAGAAQTMYVSDRMQITVRSEPLGEAKIVGMVSSGEPVEVLEDNHEGWMRVRTQAGKEGWVVRRHLMEDKPAILRLKEMTPQDKNIGARLEELQRDLAAAKRGMTQAEERAQEAEANLAKLQNDCAEVVKLREEHARLLDDCQKKTAALEDLTTENESLRFASNLKWFLAGGGVLLVGWILGAAFGRRKRRWSSNLD